MSSPMYKPYADQVMQNFDVTYEAIKKSGNQRRQAQD